MGPLHTFLSRRARWPAVALVTSSALLGGCDRRSSNPPSPQVPSTSSPSTSGDSSGMGSSGTGSSSMGAASAPMPYASAASQ